MLSSIANKAHNWIKVPLSLINAKGNHEYVAELAIDRDRFLFRAHCKVDYVTIEISEDEFNMIQQNPYMYYFSSALRVHLRAQRAFSVGLGLNYVNQQAAPLSFKFDYSCPKTKNWQKIEFDDEYLYSKELDEL